MCALVEFTGRTTHIAGYVALFVMAPSRWSECYVWVLGGDEFGLNRALVVVVRGPNGQREQTARSWRPASPESPTTPTVRCSAAVVRSWLILDTVTHEGG